MEEEIDESKKAIDILERHGYDQVNSDGIRSNGSTSLRVDILVCTENPYKVTVAENFKAQLEKLGFGVKLRKYEKSEEFILALDEGHYSFYVGEAKLTNNCDLSEFFSKEGKHIICGGTTSSIAAKYLGKPIKPSLTFISSDVPPTAEIEGVDLVTEGVITVNKVLEYAKDYLKDNKTYEHWGMKRDGASRICQLLFEEATDINFYVGRAVNPAHQNPDLPINFNIKMNLVEELSKCLKAMGKHIKVSYF